LSGEDLRVLAEEQAALRRVATLVARGVPPEELFAAVTEEAGRLLSVKYAGLGRYEPDGTFTVVAWSGTGDLAPPVGSRQILGGKNVSTLVFETGRPARIDDYADVSGPLGVAAREDGVGSGVGTPVIVEGRLWGVMATYAASGQPLPADTEARLASFTELVATAIANTQARAEVGRLAEEQAALRRVATLVAGEASPAEVFSTVTEELGRLLGADLAALVRLESANTAIVVAAWSEGEGDHVPVGTLISLEDESVARMVMETGRPARRDNLQRASDSISAMARRLGVTSTVGTPIVVEGRPWGGMSVSSKQPEPLPADTESRIADFAELVATAIANAEARTELTASRARVVAAADETRRRIERDLHDGIQQRLVALGLELRAAQATVPPQPGELEDVVSRAAEGLASVIDELREISRGIHPAILSERGLEPALRALCRRSAVPVELDLDAERRLPEPVESAAYYVVSEALTNAAKHAHASVVNVELDTHDTILQLAIRDDGIGGADLSRGSGLVGLSDRIEALGGTLQVTSPVGTGTTLQIEVPLGIQSSAVSPEP
jgi:signal transduction histidine kinase